MKKFANSIVEFLKEEDGPTAVEYAVMLALIVVVCLAAVGTIGPESNKKLQEVGSAIAANEAHDFGPERHRFTGTAQTRPGVTDHRRRDVFFLPCLAKRTNR